MICEVHASTAHCSGTVRARTWRGLDDVLRVGYACAGAVIELDRTATERGGGWAYLVGARGVVTNDGRIFTHIGAYEPFPVLLPNETPGHQAPYRVGTARPHRWRRGGIDLLYATVDWVDAPGGLDYVAATIERLTTGAAYLSADLLGGTVELSLDDGPIEVQGHLRGCHVMPTDVFAWTVTDLVPDHPRGNPWLAPARDLPGLDATLDETWR